MPKRPPTPPSTDDSQFFTIVNPYPDQPFEALEHSITFARWVACMVGEENLLAFYHKPKSPNVVIIEVSKERVNLRRLLGEHRWSEILQRPTQSEAVEASSIFPCKKNTGWSLEKIRWLRRDIESSWFKHWSPADDTAITYPYPISHFCHPPTEDITRERLFCPLPQEIFSISSAQTVAGQAPTAATTARSTPAATPAALLEFADVSADVPSLPPGLLPMHFVPAIHGADIPKADIVAVEVNPTQAHHDATLWSGYGEEAERKDDDTLCTVHNVLCHRGICKWCAARKRAAVQEERARERQQDKAVWARRRERRTGRTQSQHPHSRSTDTSCSSRSGSPIRTAPSGGRRRANKLKLREECLSSIKGKPVSNDSDGSVTGRSLPAHLRKGGSKTSNTSTTESVSPSSVASSSSGASTLDDGDSTVSSSYDSSSCKSESDGSSPRSPHVPAPWAKPAAWQTHAKSPADDAPPIVVSDEARDCRPWKRMQPMQSSRPRWSDVVHGQPRSGFRPSPVLTTRHEEDEASDVGDFDTEPF